MDRAKSFQDSFWVNDFCSAAGFDVLKKKVREGRSTCKTYIEYLQRRAKSEEEFSKLLVNSAKLNPKNIEAGNSLRTAFDSMKDETDRMATAHADLSSQLNVSVKRLNEFLNRQKTENKLREDAVDRAFKSKVNLFRIVNDAKKQYDARSTEAETAEVNHNRAKGNQNTYATKDWDKLVALATKTKSDAEKAHKNYDENVRKLEAARQEWEHEMVEYCKLCEKQEIERIRMLQNEMWTACNLTSSGAVQVDEQCEAVRKNLEKINVDADIQTFITFSGTGSERPAPVRFEPYKPQYADKIQLSGPSQPNGTLAQQPAQRLPRNPLEASSAYPVSPPSRFNTMSGTQRDAPLQIVNRNYNPNR